MPLLSNSMKLMCAGLHSAQSLAGPAPPLITDLRLAAAVNHRVNHRGVNAGPAPPLPDTGPAPPLPDTGPAPSLITDLRLAAAQA